MKDCIKSWIKIMTPVFILIGILVFMINSIVSYEPTQEELDTLSEHWMFQHPEILVIIVWVGLPCVAIPIALYVKGLERKTNG